MRSRTIKCLVWDLDNTLWTGTLLNGDEPVLRPGVERAIRELDARGILQSIASKNDHGAAWPVLEHLGVADYFLHPQIHWGGKAGSIKKIADSLGIGLDAMAFVDDLEVEREEVAFFHPEVTLIDALQCQQLLLRSDLTPPVITDEARGRRAMYRADMARSDAQAKFVGARDAFLATLDMRMSIRQAAPGDLHRAEELTLRTNQLNTTGCPYSMQELDVLARSDDHLLLIASLSDRYGESGTIGMALIEKRPGAWTIRLLIMSCRVMTRGVGTVLLGHILRLAAVAGVHMHAAFVHTERNRQMYMTYKFAGFREVGEEAGDGLLLTHDLTRILPLPPYVVLTTPDNVVPAM